MFHLGLLVVLLVAGGYAYFKYWNVVIVNGKGISRIDYIKTMERAGGETNPRSNGARKANSGGRNKK